MLCGVQRCFAQQSSKASDSLLDTRGNVYYASAKPYIDDSIPKLKKAVHELRGLKPARNQQQLPLILGETGGQLKALVEKLPNLMAQEDVVQFQSEDNGSHAQRLRHKYNYLILVRQGNGEPTFEERRTGFNGRNIGQAGLEEGFVVTAGFATIWRFFLPSVQPESRFRYLGTQQVNKIPTYVVGFAQRPGWVTFPTYFVVNQTSTPCLFQGVAWIERSGFRIVRLRTDLLAPRPDFNLQKMSTVVSFGPARIAQVASPLWLPVKAEVTAGIGGYFYKNAHHYSRYQLFRTQVRFLPPGKQ